MGVYLNLNFVRGVEFNFLDNVGTVKGYTLDSSYFWRI